MQNIEHAHRNDDLSGQQQKHVNTILSTVTVFLIKGKVWYLKPRHMVPTGLPLPQFCCSFSSFVPSVYVLFYIHLVLSNNSCV